MGCSRFRGVKRCTCAEVRGCRGKGNVKGVLLTLSMLRWFLTASDLFFRSATSTQKEPTNCAHNAHK